MKRITTAVAVLALVAIGCSSPETGVEDPCSEARGVHDRALRRLSNGLERLGELNVLVERLVDSDRDTVDLDRGFDALDEKDELLRILERFARTVVFVVDDQPDCFSLNQRIDADSVRNFIEELEDVG